jgi:hypothetical protein
MTRFLQDRRLTDHPASAPDFVLTPLHLWMELDGFQRPREAARG